MHKSFIIIFVSAIFLSSLIYSIILSLAQDQDELVVALRDNSFLPIKPPSKLHTVGAIYYIEPTSGRFTKLCSPENEISKDAVRKSPGPVISGTLTLQGAYLSNMDASMDKSLGAKSAIDDQRSYKLDFKLTNVTIYEIDIDSGKGLLDKLMNRKDCADTVTKYWHLNGYICQDTQLLVATALFDQNSEFSSGVKLDAKKAALAAAIGATLDGRLSGGEGRSVAGEGLQWGMQVPPLCITPPWAKFPRTFPRSNFDSVLNFIKFNFIEPLLPASPST